MSVSSLAEYEQLEVMSVRGKKDCVKIMKARKQGRVVCIKSFNSTKFSVIREALNESKLLMAASSRHPSICQMFDCFVEFRIMFFFVFEFIIGTSRSEIAVSWFGRTREDVTELCEFGFDSFVLRNRNCFVD